MTTVQIELWHLATLALAVLGGFWALAKVIARQFQDHLDTRFSSQDETRKANHTQLATRLDSLEQINRDEAAQWQRLERELLMLKAELPQIYVRRDDFIQAIGGISSRIDSFALRMERALDNMRKNGGAQ